MPHKKRTSTSYLKKPLSILLFSALLVSTTYISPTGATTSHSWSTTTDFGNGTHLNTASTLPDSVSLSLQGTPVVDTTYEDFMEGTLHQDSLYPYDVSEDGGGFISLRQGISWSYSTTSTPAIPASFVTHSQLSNGLLYISMWGGGLSVIDTKGTPDSADDTLNITYTETSTPAISGGVHHSHLSYNLLYVSTHNGLSVIDTKGTPDPADDELLINYKTDTIPAIGHNNVLHSHLTGGLLYAGTAGGLSVIDTKGTPDPADDELLITYRTNTTPAIGGNAIYHSHLSDNLLYVSTSGGGLSVIDTKGTPEVGDDLLLITYSTTTTPAIGHNQVRHSHLSSNLLYVSTDGGGLSVIDTKGTSDASDDVLLITYNSSSTPPIGGNNVLHSHLSDNLLYVSTQAGLSVIDTKGTPDPSDDTLLITYNHASTPAGIGWARHSHLSDGLLYVSTSGGFSVIYPEGFSSNTTFLSRAHPITTPSHFTLESTTPSSTSATLSYRTGFSEAAWEDEFDEGDTSNVSDLYAWGAPFNTVEEIGGVLTLSDPADVESGWAAMWIDTGMGEDYFPAGSVITAKVRANTLATGYWDAMFTDDWEDGSVEYTTTNEWVYLTLIPDLPFSSVGFEPYWTSGWQPEDTLEIDYVRITTRDWNPWSTPCTLTTCPINQADLVDANLIQYRLDLTTSDLSVTPSVNSVSLAYDYETTGTYTSDTLTFPQTTDLLAFTADTTIPTGTTLTFEYSTDGATWLPLSEGASLPSSTTTFTWRALLTTTDPSLSPLIHSVDLTYSPTAKSSRSSTTSVALQIANLTDQGKFEEASLLEDKFPSVSDNLNDITIRQEIIRLLRQIITLLERVAEMQRGE
jgi:hypothetical protein